MSIVDDILMSYEQIGSIKGTARKNHCSWFRVAKVLSSSGIIINDTHESIIKCYIDGLNANDIAAKLGMSVKVVSAYLPATRPYYGVNISENAKRIRKCRAKAGK